MRQLSVSKIFEYSQGQINLTGFPNSTVLCELSGSLGREVSLKSYLQEERGRKVPYLVPSFPPQYTESRQKFFRRLPPSRITKSLFDTVFPKSQWAGRSDKDFLNFCEDVYKVIQRARRELNDFRHLPEAQTVLRRLNNFDGDLENSLRALRDIDEAHTFAVDGTTGLIVPIDKMPEESRDTCYITGGGIRLVSHSWEKFREIRLRMKKTALKIIERGIADFRRRIRSFVGKEFQYSDDDNVRVNFEKLAVPIRLHNKYVRLLEKCREREEN